VASWRHGPSFGHDPDADISRDWTATAMTIVSLGVSHRIAAAEVLEKLAVPSAQRGSVLARLHAVPSVDEVAVLSTCNRVEVYAATHGPAGPVTRAVADVLAAHGRVEAGEVLRLARIRVGGTAIEHLFTVACGLDSMALGEDQIVAQLKDAARAATAAGTAGPVLTGLIDAALRASKRARTQTTISTEGISLVRAGLDLAAAHLGGLAARHAVVVGTGSTGKLGARLLREAGAGRLWVASRSQQRAAEVAAAVHGRPLRTSDVPAALADADLLVTATGAAAPVVLAGQVRAARAQAGGRPGPGRALAGGRLLVVLDLGMPPDVDPAVGRLAGLTLIDIAALVDLVVHSGKDLPTAPVPGLQIAAFPAREDPRDALVWPGGTHLGALPDGVRIGTGSPRRAALLRATGRHLQIVPIRDNVDTRLRKLADGQVDALVLAMAGLSRLGLLDGPATPLPPSLLIPAPAQGVLAIECRTDDPVAAAQLSTLDHPSTRAAAIAERGFLAALDAGCTAPVGALAELTAEATGEPELRLSGVIAAPDGSSVIRAQLNRCGQRQRHARPPASPDAARARRRGAAPPFSVLSVASDQERRQFLDDHSTGQRDREPQRNSC
jgi:glutamyl-tRNA reductase